MVSLRPDKPLHFLWVCCLLFVFATTAHPPKVMAAKQQIIPVWSYYLYPPFITDQEQGLTYDFIALLNEKANGKFSFQLHLLPKKRIELRLSSKEPGMVLFVNPAWFNLGQNASPYWTPALFTDRNVIVSNISRKVDFTGPDSVAGLKLGGVIGRNYVKLDELVNAGIVIRENVPSEESTLMMLSENRVDFSTGPESMLNHLVVQLGIKDRIYFSPIPLFHFTRHVLIAHATTELSEFMKQFTKELPSNPKWRAIMTKYQLHHAGDHPTQRISPK